MISGILPTGVAASEIIGDLENASLLPEEDAALGRVSEKRRREYSLSRVCARQALATLHVTPVPILSGPHREPLWPAGIVGSITHCKGYCAVAVARRDRFETIGIDAEIHAELPPDVLATIALDEEIEWIRAMPATGTHWDRLVFSAKESIYKAWYPVTKSWLGFKDALVTVNPESAKFHAHLLAPSPIRSGHPLSIFEGRYLVENGLVITAICLTP
jgi:4'-phosphopantetheinyl transferase EntD